MLDNVRIILIGTSHPGNIGSAARAMKTMGLSNLVLVDPECEIDGKSVALSAGAGDVLQNHKRFDTLDEAIADCGLVIGASARPRTLDWPMLDPREMGEKAVVEGQKHPIALVFGRENSGLTNDELQKIEIDPTFKVVLSYNMACCYQRLHLYEECAEYLESATTSLKERIKILDQQEQSLLMQNNYSTNQNNT